MSQKTYKQRLFSRFRHNKLIADFMYHTGKEPHPAKWIFIVGCYNSGTTLLEEVLSQHPSIAGLYDEGVVLTDALNRPEDFGWTRLWYKCYEQVKLGVTNSENVRAKRIKKHWSHFYDLSKPALVEKSIVNSTRIPFLNHYFAPAYFIYLVRNGYAVAEGIRRKAHPHRYGNKQCGATYPIELCAQQWVATHNVVTADRQQANHFLQIAYEDMVSNTTVTFRQIAQFLSVPDFPDEALNRAFHIHEKTLPITNLNETSLQQLTALDYTAVNKVASEVLTYYRYSVVEKP